VTVVVSIWLFGLGRVWEFLSGHNCRQIRGFHPPWQVS
jgi:hypothetical protein